MTTTANTTWKIDPAHSAAEFKVKHMMISNVKGSFSGMTGTLAYDPASVAAATVEAEIPVSTLSTGDAQRDAHLKSPDFLNAEAYPVLTVKSKRVEQHSPTHGRLIGDLTIRDVTHEVALDVVYSGVVKGPWGGSSAGFSGKTTINRKDWGLNWNVALEAGGWLVSEQVTVEIELELAQVAEPVAEATA